MSTKYWKRQVEDIEITGDISTSAKESLLDLFERLMAKVSVSGARKASFYTDDLRVQKGLAGFAVEISRMQHPSTPNMIFFNGVLEGEQVTLKVMGSLERA